MKKTEYENQKTVAIIPARMGSVGIQGKNHVLLDGLPLIEYTIIAAIRAELIDEIIVSTNCPKIINICQRYNNQLNVLIRPDHLSQDDSKSEDVVSHACDWYIEKNNEIGKIILLQPTSPVRTSEQIDESLQLFDVSEKPSLISVTQPMQHPYDFVFEIDGAVKYACERKNVFRRQDFKDAWFMNGAIYICDYDFFRENKKIYDLDNCFLYKMAIESSFDIDTAFDLEVCELVIRKMKKNGK